MKIPMGAPDPGRIARTSAGRMDGGTAPAARPDARRAQGGLSSFAPRPPADSTGGLMVESLLLMAKTAAQEIAGDRDAKAASHEAKIGVKQEQKEKTAEQQEAERDAAWVNVGMAVASAGASVAAGAVTGSPRGPLSDLAIGQRKALVDTIGAVRKGSMDEATASFEKAFEAGGIPTDINALVQHVLRESYMESSKDLAFYAEKVKHFNGQKKALRGQLADFRGSEAEHRRTLEEQLESAGDDAQLANIDLQNALQKTQQTLQTMSNVSKMLHDTGMAVIRKIG